MSSIISLTDRHTDTTQKLILSTAIELLESSGVTDLTGRTTLPQAMNVLTIADLMISNDMGLAHVAPDLQRLVH